MNLQGYPCTVEQFHRFKLGDEGVFRMIFEFYKPLLFNRIKPICTSVSDAEEILQEAFVQLFLKRNDIQTVDSIFPFLYVVSKRMIISLFRKQVVRQQYQLAIAPEWEENIDVLQDQIENREILNLVNQAVDSLPPQQRRVFKLSKFEGLNYSEISDEIGISKNTVRNHLVSACNYIRLRFESLILILIFINF